MAELTHQEVKDFIKQMVNASTGIKAVELAVKISEDLYKYRSAIIGILEELVKENEIVELEYVLPEMEYRVKSIYFPKGTKINKWGIKEY